MVVVVVEGGAVVVVEAIVDVVLVNPIGGRLSVDVVTGASAD